MKHTSLLLIALLVSCALSFEWAHRKDQRAFHSQRVGLPERVQREVDDATFRTYERMGKQAGNSGIDKSTKGPKGAALGFAYGLQYNEQKEGNCYSALFLSIENIDQFLTLLGTKLWYPWYWGTIFTVGMDLSTIQATIYANCDIQKLVNTIGGLTSSEGLSELVARVLGGIVFEIPVLIEDLDLFYYAGEVFEFYRTLGKLA